MEIEGEGGSTGLVAAERCEYRRIFVTWRDFDRDWIARFTDMPDIQGFDQFLNYCGQLG
jgi:hypothetical protein